MRILATGLLAALASLPLISREDLSADSQKSANIPQGILKEKDFDIVQKLLQLDKKTDLRLREFEWAKITYPTVREYLIKLYTAEQEDNELLKAGKITEKDRKVKIAYTDAVPDDVDHSDDMGTKSMFHIVKYYDDKKSGRRIYVNEHWPIREKTGGLLLPELIRTRVQAFDGPLDKPGANKLFIPFMINIIWGSNYDNSGGDSPYRAYTYNQSFYGPRIKEVDKETGKEKWFNRRAQTIQRVSNPLSCIMCHTPREKRFEIKDSELIELIPTEKIKLFDGSVTPQSEFDKPYNEQIGFRKYRKNLYERVRKGEITKTNADARLISLLNSRHIAIPNMVQILKEYTVLPWVDEDIPENEYRETSPTDGFTYQHNGKKFIRAGFLSFPGADLNTWWSKENGMIFPGSDSK